MEKLRRLHNEEKRSLIESVVTKGANILDVGCGFGGDLQKWGKMNAKINMCEPSVHALQEAKRRALNMRMSVNFYHGDIFKCPREKYDVICYNFSLHYIFQTRELFFSTLHEIRKRIKPGGIVMGIIPDSEKIIFNTPLKDSLGNFFKLKGTSYGDFGEKLFVHLIDTPYYADGPKSEPIAHKDLLITHLETMGFGLVKWESLKGNHISELYSKFIFVYRNDRISDNINNQCDFTIKVP